MSEDLVSGAPDVTTRAKRALSKILFGGAQYRLEVASAIGALRSDVFSTSDLGLALLPQVLHRELDVLERSGLVERVPDAGPRVFYRRYASRYWDWAAEASANAEEMLGRRPPW